MRLALVLQVSALELLEISRGAAVGALAVKVLRAVTGSKVRVAEVWRIEVRAIARIMSELKARQ
jgi:hypothetical protein